MFKGTENGNDYYGVPSKKDTKDYRSPQAKTPLGLTSY